jgi:hypothetical protein
LALGQQQTLQFGQREIGLQGDLGFDIGRHIRCHAAGRPWSMTDTLGLSGSATLAYDFASPSMADSKIERNRLQTVCATVIGGQKLPPQIIIEGSRHSFRVASESPLNTLHYL